MAGKGGLAFEPIGAGGPAVTQIRMTASQGHAYYEKLRAEGKSKAAARRCLKRRISRTVFHRLIEDYHARIQQTQTAAA